MFRITALHREPKYPCAERQSEKSDRCPLFCLIVFGISSEKVMLKSLRNNIHFSYSTNAMKYKQNRRTQHETEVNLLQAFFTNVTQGQIEKSHKFKLCVALSNHSYAMHSLQLFVRVCVCVCVFVYAARWHRGDLMTKSVTRFIVKLKHLY